MEEGWKRRDGEKVWEEEGKRSDRKRVIRKGMGEGGNSRDERRLEEGSKEKRKRSRWKI